MPRRGKRDDRPGDASGGGRAGFGGDAQVEVRKERAQLFSKTKMCKFFILNCCSRGDQCQFAHSKDQLAQLPDLYRTKLCKTLINTGVCNDPQCRYAHSRDELRQVDGFAGTLNAGAGRTPDAQRPSMGKFQAQQHQAQYGAQHGSPQSANPNSQMSLHQIAALGQMAHAGLPTSGGLEQVLLHMGQAAQAHAAEAMRLQATMAACLQAGGSLPQCATAAFPSYAPTAGTMPTAFGALGLPISMHQPGEMAPTAASGDEVHHQQGYPSPVAAAGGQRRGSGASAVSIGRGPAAGGGHSRQGSSEGQGYVGAEAAGRLRGSKAGVGSSASDGTPSTEMGTDGGGFAPSEPAQINFSSLRSLSSQSLSRLAEEAENAAAEGLPKDQLSAAPEDDAESFSWRVKNTFLDFETGHAPIAGKLRTVCSAAGRLDALGEEPAPSAAALAAAAAVVTTGAAAPGGSKTPSPPASPWAGPQQGGRQGAALNHVPENTTKGFGSQESTAKGFGSQESTASGSMSALPQTEKRSQDTPLASKEALMSGQSFGAAGYTVKNTFVDFGPDEPKTTGLRVVHTAAGRLDLMGQE